MQELYFAGLAVGIIAECGLESVTRKSYDHVYPEDNHRDSDWTTLSLVLGLVFLIDLAALHVREDFPVLSDTALGFATGMVASKAIIQIGVDVKKFLKKK